MNLLFCWGILGESFNFLAFSWPNRARTLLFLSTTPCFCLLKYKMFGVWKMQSWMVPLSSAVEGQAMGTPAAFYRGRKCVFIQHVASGEISRQNSCLHKALPHLSSGFLQEATAQLSARRMCLYRYLQKGEVKKRIWKCLMLSTYQQSSLCSS